MGGMVPRFSRDSLRGRGFKMDVTLEEGLFRSLTVPIFLIFSRRGIFSIFMFFFYRRSKREVRLGIKDFLLLQRLQLSQ